MAEEIFDVVDADDRVVGTEERSRVHARGLKHRSVHVLIFDFSGRLFLQKRAATKDSAPLAWDSSAAGHLESGETYDEAVLRELDEELGLKLEVLPERLFRIDARPETDWEFTWVYRLVHDGPFVLNAAEIDCGEWAHPAAITRRISERPDAFSASFVFIWERIRDSADPPAAERRR